MKNLAAMFPLLLAALALCGAVLHARSFDHTDILVVTIAGRFQAISSREGRVVVQLSTLRNSNDEVAGAYDARWRARLILRAPRVMYRYDELSRDGADHSFGGLGFNASYKEWRARATISMLWLSVPHWILATPLVVWLGLRYRVIYRRSARFERGECVACGYDLRAIESSKCPECGTPFTAAQSAAPGGIPAAS